LQQAEEALIREALRRAGGNQTQAAGLLGLSRRALNNRLSRARDEES
jgi:DNA-binding NtrC family response regulator